MPSRSAQQRLARERETLRVMLGIYCRARHGGGRGLCARCQTLRRYSEERVERCPFGDGKPTCANCPVHCFRQDEREAIREVMRVTGPRMLWWHPVLTLFHFLDGRKSRTDMRSR